jgi:hypothetical protein
MDTNAKNPACKKGTGFFMAALAGFVMGLDPGARKLGLTCSIKSAHEKLYVKPSVFVRNCFSWY